MATWLEKAGNWISDRWKEFTGQSQIEQQNKGQLDLAKYQSQLQEDYYNKYSSPQALMRQFEESGLNRNLVYGSAASGQGNVPSFQAPQLQRNMSGAEKLNKALSLINTVSGVLQGVYQASAAKETAQQSAVKTMDDIVNYKRNALGYSFDSDLFGASIGTPSTRLFRNRQNGVNFVSGDLYPKYIELTRQGKFNAIARDTMQNMYDYGTYMDGYAGVHRFDVPGLSPYMLSRNQLQALKYGLQSEIGNMGQYGKLLLGLFNLLK